MIGDSVLVSPVLQQGASSVHAYFPAGTWHCLWGSGQVIEAGCGEPQGGERQRLMYTLCASAVLTGVSGC